MGLHESSENTKQRRIVAWLLPLIFISVSVLIMALGELGQEALRYDRVWIGQGESWRLLSGHFTHLSWSHLLLNGAGLLLVWFLVGKRYNLRAWLLVVVIILSVMDLAFWFLNPELYWYVGMSGMLHGLLLAGIVAQLPRIDAETAILLLLLTLKIGWEQYAGPVPGSETTSGGPVVVDAHLYGALGGVLGGLLLRIRVRRQASI